ncbi:MAG: hypothetical protein ACYC3H_07935 [Bellilinea sp.]
MAYTRGMQSEVLRFDPYQLELTPDWVLQAQGADPVLLRSRRPHLIEIAGRAVAAGLPLLEPRALIRLLDVKTLAHRRMEFSDGGQLQGEAIGIHLAGARQVAVVLYTSGVKLEQCVAQEMAHDPPYAFALDALGTAANDALMLQVYRHISRLAEQQGWQISIFLNPGMIGWSVEQGQPQIFSLLDAEQIGVRVNPEWAMQPRKTTSGVIGIGPGLTPSQGPPCEFCALNETCSFKGKHPHPG